MSEELEMASASTPGGFQASKLPDDELFILKKHFICHGICLAVRAEIGRKQLTAFVAANGDLNLHFLLGDPSDQYIMKLVPWFADPNKRITAMCFDPSGSWLVIAGYDSTIFVVPALALIDNGCPQDHRWATNDVTIFPALKSQYVNVQGGHPTAIVWWQSLLDCSHTAVVANDQGEISFMSLTNGSHVGVTYVRSPLSSLCLCQDNSMDSLFLLVTDESQAQWRLLLEQRNTGYSWLTDTTGSASDLSSSQGSVDLDFNGRTSTARSRLQGLKQLSVEKLAILRQKLAETRTKGVMSVGGSSSKRGLSALLREPDTVSSGVSSGNEDTTNLNNRRIGIVKEPTFTSSGPRPERLSSRVGDTFLQPQQARGRHLLSGYYSPSSILTVHGTNLEVVPLFVHKLPPQCRNILLTDRFLFVVDSCRSSLSVISCQLSECRLDGNTDFDLDSRIATFNFPGEKVVEIFKCTESNYRKEEVKTTEDSDHSEMKTRECIKVSQKSSLPQQQSAAKDFKLTPIESPPVDSCVVVTNQGMYTIRLKTPAPDVFLELVLHHKALERAERLALVFGLSLQQLLEHAGDLRLAARDFPNAIALYKLSKCRHLKSVLKFAAGGFSAELLSYVNLLFSTTASPQQYLTSSEKIHLSNLAVMCNTEQVLRSPVARASLYKNFLKFLRENTSYDEVLAVNVAGQTGLWDVLLHLCTERGLHIQVLEVLAKVFRSGGIDSNLPEGFAVKLAPTRRATLWMCASEPSLQQALLARPPLARCHLLTMATHLSDMEMLALKRLAALYDPSTPSVRPFLKHHFGRARCKSESNSSVITTPETCDVLDASVNEEAVFPLEILLQTFLLVLLHIASRQPGALAYDKQLVKRLPPATSKDADHEEKKGAGIHLPTQNHPLSAGFAHVALVRNGSVYVWGGSALGCLGIGPAISRFSSPQPTGLFPSLLLEVISVACGRQHTMALTTNGVFTWGSSYFGQLGVGRTVQSPTPRLVEALTEELIVTVAAGQYHCLALTEDGRYDDHSKVFSWGWGVHGQLGHCSVEDEHAPRMVQSLKNHPIVQVSGGHGHSLALGADGSVYAFGSNVFGQLGNGNCIKSTVPVKVTALPENIVCIATAYFHNLAVSSTNQLYTWGSSPQALRLQAQAQKKARLLQQQANISGAQNLSESTQSSESNAPSSSSSSSSFLSFPSTSAIETTSESSESVSHTRPNSDSSSCANVAVDRKAVKAQLTLENIPHSSKKSGVAAKVSTDPVMLFDEEFPDVAKLDGGELVAPGLPAIVVSPTVEFKGLSPPPVSTNSDGLVGLSSFADSSNNSLQWEADESQAHLLPQKVDTGLVTGSITQISCGCHHSALLTNDGVLYVWGRNLDGQVGNGSRKEVIIPTPLSCAPTVSLKSAVGGLSNALPTAGMERTHLQHISCGCDFTTALEVAGGRVWAWGNNSQGQLGFPPVEDSKPLDGKLVVLKTSKRIIKLPHGMHNACDLPREVSGIPPPALYSFPDSQLPVGSSNSAWEGVSVPSLSRLEEPPYGARTLHTALQSFHGLYDTKTLLSKCVELENYQAAARLAALDRHYHVALAYQLRALMWCSNPVPHVSTVHSDDVAASVNLKNDRNANRRGFAASKNVTEEKRQKFHHKRTSEEAEKSKIELSAMSVDITKAKESLQICNITATSVRSDSTVNTNDAATGSLSSTVSAAADVECSSTDSSNKNLEREECQNASVSSTPDSVASPATAEDAEIHAFSIQGGREQMSEVGRSLGSPDSGLSLPSGSPAHCSLIQSRPGTIMYKKPQECSGGGETRIMIESEVELEMPELIMPPSNSRGCEAQEQDSKLSAGSDLVQEASALVEYYVSLMEEESHDMMSKLLMQGFDFWLQNALPMDHLESLLLRHMPKFCLPLGLLIFCKDTDEGKVPEPALLHQLSTSFCLQLCSLLLSHINQKKPHPEYIEALTKMATTTQGLNGCTGGLTAASEHQLEAALSGLRGVQTTFPGFFSQPFITLTPEDLQGSVLSDSERLLVFSCGHHYGSEIYEQELLPELENTLHQLSTPLPGTARLLKGAYSSMGAHLACPRCILSHIQEQVLA